MKIGYCLLMVSKPDDPLGRKWIKTVKDAGFDYAEIPVGRLVSRSDEEVASYKAELDAAGLPAKVFNCSLSDQHPLVGPNTTEAKVDEYIARVVSLAETFGVKMITSCGPVEGMTGPGFDWENIGKPQYRAFLKKMGRACAEKGITYAIEPIFSGENGYVSTTTQAAEHISAVGMDNIGIIVDWFHFDREGEDFSLLPGYAKNGQLVHIHFADLEKRYVPHAGAEATYAAQLKPVLDAGYEGFISIEAKTDDPAHDLPIAVKALKSAIC